ncbi:MAG: CoA transferase [Trueperaceae bacterium]|nr:MAG: CoA transferase [Trueperaceae bacterium]
MSKSDSRGQERTPQPQVAGPLAGFVILDLTRVLAGPYATMQLGDLGADIIKVEPPKGDDSRYWGPPWLEGESAFYLGVNRNKRSIVLNFKTPAAREALRRLVTRCDVVVENYKAGTMERWGLGYEEVLRPLNPALVYCSLTGFGRNGPSSHLPGYDPIIEAMGGLMSVTGDADGPPMRVGVAMVDIVAGCQLAFAVSAALVHRLRTGEGQRVDLSLFESNLSALANQASAYLTTGVVPGRHGNAHPAIVPYQVFRARDEWVMVCAGNDGQYRRLCELLGSSELAADERFSTNRGRVENREKLEPLLGEILERFDAEELVRLGEALGVPIATINTLDRVFAHPQVVARDMVLTVDHPSLGPIDQVGIPTKFSLTPGQVRMPPPLHGEHTVEVLTDFGFSEVEIAALREDHHDS